MKKGFKRCPERELEMLQVQDVSPKWRRFWNCLYI